MVWDLHGIIQLLISISMFSTNLPLTSTDLDWSAKQYLKRLHYLIGRIG